MALVETPTLSQTGLVAIILPPGTATSGTGAVVPLPTELSSSNGSTAPLQAKVTLANGRPLPAWIRYSAEDHTLVLGAVPDGSFPLQLVMVSGGQRSVMQISEDGGR